MARVTAFQAVGRGFESRLPLFVALACLLAACGDSNVETVKRGEAPKTAQTPAETGRAQNATESTAAGVKWNVPSGWQSSGPRPMRVATYFIGSGDSQAECAVFFFGTGQGGDVQSNISRWIGQFTQPDGADSKSKATLSSRDVNGLKLSTIELTGTYSAGGMMGQPAAPRPGYRLLGAIVDAPEGPVFFKLTGPDAAVSSIRAQFETLVGSLSRT